MGGAGEPLMCGRFAVFGRVLFSKLPAAAIIFECI